MDTFKGIWAVFGKDLKTEFRSRYVINTVLAFVGASMLLILFSLRAEQLSPTPKSGVVWIVILFAALSSLSRSFVMETDRLTYDLLRLHGVASEVFLGKLTFNFAFTLFVNIVTFLVYIFLLGIPVSSPWALLLTLVVGTAGLSGVATMLAAIVSQADRKGAVFSVLSIPLFFPLLLVLIRATKAALFEAAGGTFLNDLMALVGYAGVTISAGILLFDYIWEE
ncbi:MAG: heme exporter protein CcmB [Balneolaceae bacterium]|nr:heme exporter protein CcmB [Balneolaceae bacterium]